MRKNQKLVVLLKDFGVKKKEVKHMKQAKISFPEEYIPSKCAIHVRNEIEIAAPIANVWFWLTNVTTWPEWYANSSNVKTVHGGEFHLTKDSIFKWRTFNTNIISEVQEFEKESRLAWTARGVGLSAYHAWLIIPTESGCKVITEETQKGILPSVARWFIQPQLFKWHQKWLEGLKAKSEGNLEN